MATRRSRIKGIANIPQRRKPDNKPPEALSNLEEPSGSDATNHEISTILPSTTKEIFTPAEPTREPTQESVPKPNAPGSPLNEGTENSTETTASVPSSRRRFIKPGVNVKLLSQKTKECTSTSVPSLVSTNQLATLKDTPVAAAIEPIVPCRRSVIKPAINAKLLAAKSKPSTFSRPTNPVQDSPINDETEASKKQPIAATGEQSLIEPAINTKKVPFPTSDVPARAPDESNSRVDSPPNNAAVKKSTAVPCRRAFIKPAINAKLLSQKPKEPSPTADVPIELIGIAVEAPPDANTEAEKLSVVPHRRTVIKPAVNAKLLSRKPKAEPLAAGDSDTTNQTINPSETKEKPSVKTTEKPFVKTIERPSVETTAKPIEPLPVLEAAEKLSVKTTEKPFVKTTEQPFVKAIEKPSVEATVKPSVKTTEKPFVKTIEKPSPETTVKPSEPSPVLETTEKPSESSPAIEFIKPAVITKLPSRKTKETDVTEIAPIKSEAVEKAPNVPSKSKLSFIKPSVNVKMLAQKLKEAVNASSEPLVNDVKSSEDSAGAAPQRRTFIKPLVNPKLLSQRLKPKLETKLEKIGVPEPIIEIPSTDDNSPVQLIKNSLDAKTLKPNDYVPEPLSPTKLINRSRIKAVPRLGQRRTSVTIHGSASESEDDTKKNFKRIRTESSCSTVSTGEPQYCKGDPGSPQKSKEFSTIIQRKCKRTEQSRKMAEARRHFVHKFGNKAPDKQKLTMIDLIFYNPNSNPMSQKPKKSLIKVDKEEEVEPEEPDREDADDIHSDEENTIPAPQIKIGANGEIVIDEKSLIIENAQTKKERAELQRSELIDGDFDTSYGIYKREKRSKDWSKEETLLFYKALNTLGTDFTLMVPLFAGRSRRELKMKFKKEERVNRQLVDKALTQPIEFNFTDLHEEVENKKKKAEEERVLKAKEVEEWNANKKTIDIPYKTSFAAIRTRQKTNYKKKKRRSSEQPKDPGLYSKLRKGIATVWERSDESETSDSAEEDTIRRNILKPTRCGRIPKPTNNNLTSACVRRRPSLRQESPEPEPDNTNELQPGSLMIVYSQAPTGQPAFKVFMVTPDQCRVPITLTPDMLSNLTEGANRAQIEVAQVPPPPEHNYTIAHDGGGTLKSSEEVEVSDTDVENEMCPYEQPNVSVPVEDEYILPDQVVTLCSDGKYNVPLSMETEQSVVA